MTNIVLLAGNVGNDPESATTFGGTTITTFSLATSRPRRVDGKVVKGENGYAEQETEWHRVKCFNGKAKSMAEHGVKGMKVAVKGRIHYTKWAGQGRQRPLRHRDPRRRRRLHRLAQARGRRQPARDGRNPLLSPNCDGPAKRRGRPLAK